MASEPDLNKNGWVELRDEQDRNRYLGHFDPRTMTLVLVVRGGKRVFHLQKQAETSYLQIGEHLLQLS